MAKIAKCGYGSRGQGVSGNAPDGYSYVVDDSVQRGQKIQVVATSRKGKKFATTAVPLHIYKRTSVKGFQARQQAEEKAGEVTQSYTGKELGAGGSREYDKNAITGKTQPSQYVQETRAGNLAKYLEKHSNAELSKNASETYAEYAAKFMNKGEQQ